jgi:hypothetical protein
MNQATEENAATAEESTAIRSFHTPERIQRTVPNLQAESRKRYIVEWGGRVTDGALILHFFPPLTPEGDIGVWPDDSDMDKRLEKAIPAIFDTNRVTAGFEPEWDSFYIIAGGYAASLGVRLLVKRFLDAVDSY